MVPESDQDEVATSLIDALLVYAEPLAADAHAVVIGDAEGPVADALLEAGARSVVVFDPDGARAQRASRQAPRGVTVRSFAGELEVRDGTFDLAVIPDLSDLDDPPAAVDRLKRAVAVNGAVVSLGRARSDDPSRAFGDDLGPGALTYDEIYELFDSQFDGVTIAGVLPFTGVVFAQLGGEEDPAVSVDTRLVRQEAPAAFVVVAGVASRGTLDPYALVQVDDVGDAPGEDSREIEAIIAAATLKAELLAAQVESLKDRLVVADVRAIEQAAHLDRAGSERDAALTRAMELEAVLSAGQHTLATIERTLLEAERGMLERDDRIAQLAAEIESRNSASPDVTELLLRAERAEAALAIAQEELESPTPTAVDVQIEDLAILVQRAERAETDLAAIDEARATEIATYESQLRDRARMIAALEKELVRREQLVRELVSSVEDANGAAPHDFEASAPLPVPARGDDTGPLRQKLDELAKEVARREGELVARGWRIAELENQMKSAPMPTVPTVMAGDVGKLQDELDALRQALAQEHEARILAESGEELSRARAELAKQATLLEQIRAQRETS